MAELAARPSAKGAAPFSLLQLQELTETRFQFRDELHQRRGVKILSQRVGTARHVEKGEHGNFDKGAPDIIEAAVRVADVAKDNAFEVGRGPFVKMTLGN